jgi:hypothetical protein
MAPAQDRADPPDETRLGAVSVDDVVAPLPHDVHDDEDRLEVAKRTQRPDYRDRPDLHARRERGLHDVGLARARDVTLVAVRAQARRKLEHVRLHATRGRPHHMEDAGRRPLPSACHCSAGSSSGTSTPSSI